MQNSILHKITDIISFLELWKAKGRPFQVCHFSSYFHWSDAQPKFFNPFLCMMVVDTSSMPKKYIYCQKLNRFSGVLTAFSISSSRRNKISQTAQALGSHIYWQDIPSGKYITGNRYTDPVSNSFSSTPKSSFNATEATKKNSDNKACFIVSVLLKL